MDMTYKDYIDNPMGRSNAVIGNREMYRSMYQEKFNKVLLRENGKIDYTLYKDKENYYIHLKIPSETIKDFYYDVVIQFYTKDKKLFDVRTLDQYHVKFYSNDPAFVYTFAHAFIKNKIFIDSLSSKMSKEAIRRNANEKNPKNEVGYVKTLYFAYLYMKSKGLFTKIHYVSAKTYNAKELSSIIMDADEKIKLRQDAGVEKQERKKRIQHDVRTGNVTKDTFKVQNTKTTGTTKNIGVISKTKTVGKVKKK